MTDKICGIYKITNNINGKCYIGQSVDIKLRWKTHISNSKRDKTNNRFYNSLRKNGVNNFEFEIIIICDKNMLNYFEMECIKLYETTNPNKGYNLTIGGDCAILTEEGKLNHLKSVQTKENRERVSNQQKELLEDVNEYNKRCEQLNSVVRRVPVEYKGIKYNSLIEFADSFPGIKPATIISRYLNGYDVENNRRDEIYNISYNNMIFKNQKELAKYYKLPVTCVRRRLMKGAELEEPIRREYILYGLAIYTYKELSDILGIEQRSIRRRNKDGVYIHSELVKTQNHKSTPTKIIYDNKTYDSKSDLAREFDITLAALSNRIKKGKINIKYV